MNRYTDRVVMVTGAAQGLGAAMAQRFAAEGALLAVSDVNPATISELASFGKPGRVRAAVVDVAAPEQVKQWVGDTVAEFGRVDALVNNAGVFRDSRFEQMSDTDWDTVLDINLKGVFLCSRAVFGPMKAQGYGRIVSISSIAWRGHYGSANYAAAKAGVVGLARTIALEGAAHGITSNVIAPGTIDTPMLGSLESAARDRLTARVPARRIGQPADVAEAAAFLCSEAAGYVTGVVLDVDGGLGIGNALR